MANIIQKFVIFLGLDGSGLEKGVSSSEKRLDDLEKKVASLDKKTNDLSGSAKEAGDQIKNSGDAAKEAGGNYDKAAKSSDDLAKGEKGVSEAAKNASDSIKKNTKDVKENSKGNETAIGGAKKLSETFDKSSKSAKKSSDALSQSFSKARNEALALFAVFTGGRTLKTFTSDINKTNANLGYVSQRLNVNPRELFQTQNMLRSIGGNPDDIPSFINSLQQKALDPQQAANLNKAFARLRIPNWQKLLNRPLELLRELNRSTQGMPQQNKNFLLSQIGINGSTVDLIDETTKKFDELSDAFKGLGPTDEQIAHSQKLLQEWTQLKAASEALGRSLEDDLFPYLDKIIKDFIYIEQRHPGWVKAIAAVTAAFVAMSTAVKGMLIAKAFADVFGVSLAARGGLKLFQKSLTTTVAGAVSEGVLTGLVTLTKVGGKTLLKGAPVIGTAASLLSPNTSIATNEDDIVARHNRFSDSKNFPSEKFNIFADAIARHESDGKGGYSAVGGYNNNYLGRYQMGMPAITDAAHILNEKIPTKDEFLSDHKMQDRFFKAYTDMNYFQLSKDDAFRKLDINRKLAALAYAHLVGSGNVSDFLRGRGSKSDGFGTQGSTYYNDVAGLLDQYDHATGGQINNTSTDNSHRGNINITGGIHIKTNGTDGHAIARDIHAALSDPLALAHSNARGLR